MVLVIHCFDYCTKNNYHMFCNVDCLRSPKMCSKYKKMKNSHTQLDITSKNIEAIENSLNTLREQCALGKLEFKSTQKVLWAIPFQTIFNLEIKPYKMNKVVSLYFPSTDHL